MAKRRLIKGHRGELTAAVCLGFFEVLALSLYYRDSIRFWFRTAGGVFAFLGLWLLSAALLFLFFRLITALLAPDRIRKPKAAEQESFAEKHPFLLSVIVLAICYLPWIVIFYPGSALYDMMYQTVQADGFIPLNAHHPIFSTFLMGLCSRIGLWLTGRLNLGIFLYILLQSSVCVLSFSYLFSFLKQTGAGKGFRYSVLAFFAVTPLWGGMMQFGTKDILFTGLFVLFLVQSAKLLLRKEEGREEGIFPAFRPWEWILYGAVILLLMLNRNAVILIMIPTLLVFFFAAGKKGTARKGFAIAALAAVVLAAGFSFAANAAFHTKTETGEILSIPFQQTARTVRDEPDSLTKEEQETIEKVFALKDYKKLGTLYYPMSSDPVKARYHWWASEEENKILREYAGAWASMLKKEPVTYAEAALSQTYGYYTITPVFQNQKGGAGTNLQFFPDTYAVRNAIDRSGGLLSEDLVPESPKALEGARNVLSGWYGFWQKAPVLGLLMKCGFYFYLLLALTISYGKRKNRLTVLAIPCFLLVLMAVASPVNEHIRYILPVIAALPVLPAAAAAEEKKNTFGGEHERESFRDPAGDQ